MEPLAQSELHGLEFAKRLDASDVAALRRLPAQQILQADSTGVAWPVIDGKLIPGDEHRLFEAGKIAQVPLMLGSTADEGFIFSHITSLEGYRDEVKRRYGTFAPQILAAYPAADDAQAIRQARDLLRDVMFGWGTWDWARLAAKAGGVPVHVYYFDHAPPHAPGMPAGDGAIHGADLPYAFGIEHQPRAWTQTDKAISDAMVGYISNFVKTGDPNGPGLPVWPAFTRVDDTVLHVTQDLTAGPAANARSIDLIDRYMAARRAQGGLGAPQ